MKFTWEGRQLKTAAANGKSISYSYKSDGTRVGFTYNGQLTTMPPMRRAPCHEFPGQSGAKIVDGCARPAVEL